MNFTKLFSKKKKRWRRRTPSPNRRTVALQIPDPAAAAMSSRREWSELPDIALFGVLIHLSDLADTFSFAAVCRSWRSVSKTTRQGHMISQPPLLFTPPVSQSSPALFYNPIHKRLYRCFLPVFTELLWDCIGFTGGYLVLVNKPVACELPARRIIVLVNPFTEDIIRPPPVHYYYDSAVLFPPKSSPQSRSLLLCNKAVGFFHYWQPDSPEWVPLHEGEGIAKDDKVTISDIVVFRGRFYVLTKEGGLLVLELFPFAKMMVVRAEALPDRGIHCLLATSGKDLFAAVNKNVSGKFLVYRLDLPGGTWVRVKDLGGRALLFGFHRCMVCDEPWLWGGRGNCFYSSVLYPCQIPEFPRLGRPWGMYLLNGDMKDYEPLPEGLHYSIFHPPTWILPGLCYGE